MLTEEDDVEIHALAARGWKVSQIARHTGRDRKTVAKYLKGEGGGQHRAPAASSCLEPFRGYIEARFVDDPHLDATVLHRELAEAGFDRSIRRSFASCVGSSCGRFAWSASTIAARR
ncbi:MAG: hypothetical protein M3N47_14600 [Chloroflexota bacterium]|nr:hypothetical protein [Chloroflexota bacterium]